jgi:hypothetical protein
MRLTSQRSGREKISLQARKRNVQIDRLDRLQQRRDLCASIVASNVDNGI